jgi:hypothetical protein
MADGTVLQTVFDKEHPKQKRFKIAHEQVVALLDEIRRSDFFSLAEKYLADAEDCATFVIAVRAGGRSHEVTFATCFRTAAERSRVETYSKSVGSRPSPVSLPPPRPKAGGLRSMNGSNEARKRTPKAFASRLADHGMTSMKEEGRSKN